MAMDQTCLKIRPALGNKVNRMILSKIWGICVVPTVATLLSSTQDKQT